MVETFYDFLYAIEPVTEFDNPTAFPAPVVAVAATRQLRYNREVISHVQNYSL
jgi:hypothetical protein